MTREEIQESVTKILRMAEEEGSLREARQRLNLLTLFHVIAGDIPQAQADEVLECVRTYEAVET